MKKHWGLFLVFKAGWFGLVLAPNYAIWPVLLVLVWQLTQMVGSNRIRWLALSIVGMSLDTVLIAMGYLQTASAEPLPAWLAVLWAWFIWAWLQLFSPLLPRAWQVLVFCGIGGPLAYRGGALLSDQLIYPDDWQFALIHSICWLGLGALMVVWRRRAHEQNYTTA